MTRMKRIVLGAIVAIVVLSVAVTVYATTRPTHQIDRNRVDHVTWSYSNG